MNTKNYKKYIVVDEVNRPMSFNVNQFFYCDTHHARQPHPIETYTYKKAIELIKKAVEYRTKNNFPIGEYNLMPVAPKIKKI